MEHLKLNAILNNSIVSITDTDGIITYASPQFCSLFGYSDKELVGHNYSLIKTNEHNEDFYSFMWLSLKKGKTWKGELKNKNKKGDFIWNDISIIPISDKGNNIIEYVAIYNDISHQKKLVSTLKERSHRQGIISILGQIANNTKSSKLFIEQSISAITSTLEMDFGCVIKFNNSHQASIIASTSREIIDDDQIVNISQENSLWSYAIQHNYEAYCNNIKKDKRFSIPEKLQNQNFTSSICILVGDTNKPFGLISFFSHNEKHITDDDIFFVKSLSNIIYDVITRFVIKKALIKEKELTSKYLDIAEVMILVLDADFNITLANRKTSTVLGINQDEILNKNWIETFIPEEEKEKETSVLQNIFTNNTLNSTSCHLIEIYDCNKFLRKTKWSHTLLADKENNTTYIISAGEDITDLENAKTLQASLQKELHQAQKMEAIGMITGGITHDFNNILASILGFTNLAIEKFSGADEKLSMYLNEIEKGGCKARDIIEQMQNFDCQPRHDSHPEDITSLLSSILKMLRSAIPSSIQFDKKIDKNLPPAIIRPDNFNQVIMHLLIHARNATHNKGNINLNVSEAKIHSSHCSSCRQAFSGHFIKLTITDDGDGLTKNQIDSIFTNNEQQQNTDLAIVHRIIHESGAHMIIDSTLNIGSQVSLFFEVAKHHNTSQASHLLNKKINSNTHFMIVDDENSVANFLGEFITTQGYKSSVFTDPTEALKAFTEAPDRYDIVITDQTMPIISGYELIQKIRKLKNNVPTILCTGHSDLIDESKNKNLNVDAFLHKPFDANELLSSIYQIIN